MQLTASSSLVSRLRKACDMCKLFALYTLRVLHSEYPSGKVAGVQCCERDAESTLSMHCNKNTGRCADGTKKANDCTLKPLGGRDRPVDLYRTCCAPACVVLWGDRSSRDIG